MPRAAGVVAGLPVAAWVFDSVGQGRVRMEFGSIDGATVAPGEVLATVRGPVRDLLTAERTALNLLGHLSGVATLTRRWVDAVAGTGVQVRDTRKTLPGLRALEKYAVRCGGGVNHRMSLSDAALIKDNHVAAAGGVVTAFDRVRNSYPDLPLEVEVDTVAQAREVIDAGADLVLLDNMPLGRIAGGRRLCASVRVAGQARSIRRAEPRPGRRGRGDRRRLPGGRRAHPFRAGARHRDGPAVMLLAIDIGNTNTVLGVFDGEKLDRSWRIKTDSRSTADELALTYRGLLADHPVDGIAACSTVPAAMRELRQMLADYYGNLPTVLVEPGMRTGVSLQYENPKEVGADRIVNTLAAYHLVHGPAIVVDFGTTTNFDVVNERGDFLGGALAPGIEISLDALAARAAQLRKVELVEPRGPIGKNTVEALQSGILYGFAGQVDALVRRLRAALVPDDPASVAVIATGGLAPLVIATAKP